MKLGKLLIMGGLLFGGYMLYKGKSKLSGLQFSFKGFKNISTATVLQQILQNRSLTVPVQPVFEVHNPFPIALDVNLKHLLIFDEHRNLLSKGVLPGNPLIVLQPGSTVIDNLVFDTDFGKIIKDFIGKQSVLQIHFEGDSGGWPVSKQFPLNIEELLKNQINLN